jgi:hypothetical protein
MLTWSTNKLIEKSMRVCRINANLLRTTINTCVVANNKHPSDSALTESLQNLLYYSVHITGQEHIEISYDISGAISLPIDLEALRSMLDLTPRQLTTLKQIYSDIFKSLRHYLAEKIYTTNYAFFNDPIDTPESFAEFYRGINRINLITEFSKKFTDMLYKEHHTIHKYYDERSKQVTNQRPLITFYRKKDFTLLLSNDKFCKFLIQSQNNPAILAYSQAPSYLIKINITDQARIKKARKYRHKLQTNYTRLKDIHTRIEQELHRFKETQASPDAVTYKKEVIAISFDYCMSSKRDSATLKTKLEVVENSFLDSPTLKRDGTRFRTICRNSIKTLTKIVQMLLLEKYNPRVQSILFSEFSRTNKTVCYKRAPRL